MHFKIIFLRAELLNYWQVHRICEGTLSLHAHYASFTRRNAALRPPFYTQTDEVISWALGTYGVMCSISIPS